jgi:cytochrome c biogenesis protein CcdA
MINEILIFTFTAGLVAAFNPCGILMFPAYIGYQLKFLDMSDSKKLVSLLLIMKSLSLGIYTSFGFVTLFAISGFLLALFGSLIRDWIPLFGLLVGIFLVITGLFLLIFQKKIMILFFSRASSIGSGIKNQNLSMFIFGIGYGLASLSCALPIYLAAIGLVIGTGIDFINIIFYSLIYASGMSLVLIGTSLGVVLFKHSVNQFVSKISKYVEQVGIVLMILAGIFIIHYWLVGSGSTIFYDSIIELF